MSFYDEKRKTISKLFEKSIELMNKEIDLKQWHEFYSPHEERSLLIHIENFDDLDTGYVIKDNMVRRISKTWDEPTTSMWLSEDSFLIIASGEITLERAFLEGSVIIDGQNWLRDLRIFQRMLDKHKNLFSRLRE